MVRSCLSRRNVFAAPTQSSGRVGGASSSIFGSRGMVTNGLEYGLELFAKALFKKQLGFLQRGLTRRDQPDSILSFRIQRRSRRHPRLPAFAGDLPVANEPRPGHRSLVRGKRALHPRNPSHVPGAPWHVFLRPTRNAPTFAFSPRIGRLHCMTLGPMRSRGPLSGRMPRRRATS